ncbi:tyrosine-type recombinase/integrase [Acidobacteriota bacterium]
MSPVYKRGSKWYVDYKDASGTRQRHPVATNREEADFILGQLLARKRGIILGVETFVEPTTVYFSELCKDYFRWMELNRSPKSVEYVRKHVNRHLLPFFGDIKVTAFSPKDIEQYKEERCKKVKPVTVNKELTTLGAVFNWAVKKKRLASKPVTIEKLKSGTEVKAPRFLSLEETHRMLEELVGLPRNLFYFAILTGMRSGEIFGLRREHVDLKQGTILIRAETSKSRRMRVFPIYPELREFVFRLPRDGELLFHRNGNPLAESSTRSAFEYASKRAGIEPRVSGLRICRHTFASLRVQRGESLFKIQKLLGHKSPDTTQIYSHITPRDLEDTAASVEILCTI